MRKPNEYTFRIDAFTPDTLPMSRLAQYISALAELVGSKDATHFDRVFKGSAKLAWRVEDQDAPKVERRLLAIRTGQPAKDAERAFKSIDDMLAEDNAIAELMSPTGDVVIPFPGRTRPKSLVFPAFTQAGSIDGQVVSIGGRDKSAHVILQDGPIAYSNIELKRDVARLLAPYLYGPKIRLFGSGRWERTLDGSWKLLRFSVDRYDVLDDTPLAEVIADIRSLSPALARDENVYDELMDLRLGKDEIH
ncbi:hypothetical protein CSW58_08960 [Caulobacter sp. B11]|uniref:hypothetical protein n=1 Tax=Caulobacter sp. B11 TaxID=2048899 RepID=UPI000C13A9CD|nr:hypothetical protein [Caulobacter sp. B11]PHY12974.1 hypothetical protein CSW58_08960 [Caulobacter sp. B11]